ncbi:hypothetical protein BUE80_DR005504 [Diplocarpon rosae]|nr:hypothetical protein BUE80_DR005504 [Diplocarpon rosae]
MDALVRLKDTFVQFLSPVAKRRRTVGPGTLSTSEDHEYFVPNSEPRGSKAQAAALDHINQKYLSTPQPKNPRKRARVEEEDEIVISPRDSISQKSLRFDESDGISVCSPLVSEDSGLTEEEGELVGEDSGLLGEDGEDDVDLLQEEGDVEMVDDEDDYSDDEEADEAEVAAREALEADQKVEEYLARQAELASKRDDIEKVKATGDWHPDAVFLYERLVLRSFEPLIPADWHYDFPTLPGILFTRDDELTLINSNSVKALQALISLGVRTRDKLVVGKSPEKMIQKEIQNYIKWSEKDGGFFKRRFIPVHTIVCARSSQTAGSIGKAITSQMRFLGERHREQLAIPGGRVNELGEVEMFSRNPPLLYGLIISQTKVILTTCVSDNPDAEVKHIELIDFTNRDMDVWNGFAIAFIIIAARNYVMSIKDELELDSTPESDVDA